MLFLFLLFFFFLGNLTSSQNSFLNDPRYGDTVCLASNGYLMHDLPPAGYGGVEQQFAKETHQDSFVIDKHFDLLRWPRAGRTGSHVQHISQGVRNAATPKHLGACSPHHSSPEEHCALQERLRQNTGVTSRMFLCRADNTVLPPNKTAEQRTAGCSDGRIISFRLTDIGGQKFGKIRIYMIYPS